MEKIAILIRWPIRPDINSCLINIENLIKQINWFEIETFFLTWADEKVSDFIKNDKNKIIDNYIILKEPSLEYIETQLKTRCKVPWPLFDRNYKMFWSQKLWLNFIISNWKKYDYIITTRPDLEIDLIDINKWLIEDIYIMPNPIDRDCDINIIWIVDQFWVAKSKIMYNAWNYININTLNELYWNSNWPEDCFNNILKLNNVKIANILTKYELNPKRNFNDINYPYKNRQKIYHYLINPLTKIFWKKFETKIFNIIQNLFPYK